MKCWILNLLAIYQVRGVRGVRPEKVKIDPVLS